MKLKLLLMALATVAFAQDSPIVTVKQGQLKGTILSSREGKQYYGYMGIPYAKPPERFQLSQEAGPWEGVWDATHFGSKCWQTDWFTQETSGSEDCLFLNVYTTKLEASYPVMVFIHGGGFQFGSGNEYGAKYFMDENIVLVTINYRLAALGFLSTGDGQIQGNMGMKDQVLALKWVQQNIHHFGGDTNRVTIFGESAGAASVEHHMLSPMSKGLFHNAILQSGSSLNPWAIIRNPEENAEKLGTMLKCSEELVECLKKADAKTIIMQNFAIWNTDPVVPFGPVVENDVGSDNPAFLPIHPSRILMSGTYNKVPLIVTICEDEGLLLHSAEVMYNPKLLQEINQNWDTVAPVTLFFTDDEFTPSQKTFIMDRIKKYYFGKKDIGQETFQNLTNLYSDRYFIHGMTQSILTHAKDHPVYTGIVAYSGQHSMLAVLGIPNVKKLGVTHVDDIGGLFNTPYIPEPAKASQDEIVSKFFVKLWVNFAESGDPKFNFGSVTWPKVSAGEAQSGAVNWLRLDVQPKILKDPFKRRFKFWTKTLHKAVTKDIPITKDEL